MQSLLYRRLHIPLYLFYNAGACFPLQNPFGCFEQELDVNEDNVENCCPQYLQVYLVFSVPSYSLCFPLQNPLGCFEHELDVSEETLENFCPQYSQ